MLVETITSLPNRLGMPDRGEEGDAATERIAHDVRPAQPEMADQRRDVVAHQADVDRPVDVGGPAVALEVGDDHLVARRPASGSSGPNISPDPSPPWSRTSGRPVPCVS